MNYFLQQLVNGVTLGSMYGLIAIGYSMVYGIIGMINFAHGEVYMIGAFLTIIVFTLLGMIGLTWVPLALLTVLIVAMLVTATVVCLLAMLTGLWASFHLDSAPAPTIILILTATFLAAFLRRVIQTRRA